MLAMATRDLTRRFAELRVLQHGVEGGSENKRPGDAFSESGLLDVRKAFMQQCNLAIVLQKRERACFGLGSRLFCSLSVCRLDACRCSVYAYFVVHRVRLFIGAEHLTFLDVAVVW